MLMTDVQSQNRSWLIGRTAQTDKECGVGKIRRWEWGTCNVIQFIQCPIFYNFFFWKEKKEKSFVGIERFSGQERSVASAFPVVWMKYFALLRTPFPLFHTHLLFSLPNVSRRLLLALLVIGTLFFLLFEKKSQHFFLCTTRIVCVLENKKEVMYDGKSLRYPVSLF